MRNQPTPFGIRADIALEAKYQKPQKYYAVQGTTYRIVNTGKSGNKRFALIDSRKPNHFIARAGNVYEAMQALVKHLDVNPPAVDIPLRFQVVA